MKLKEKKQSLHQKPTRKKTQKRNVTLLPNYKEYLILSETRTGFCDYTVVSIQEALERDEKTAKLFIVNNTHEFLLDKEYWKGTLEQIIKVYQLNEQYEKCSDCVNLISCI